MRKYLVLILFLSQNAWAQHVISLEKRLGAFKNQDFQIVGVRNNSQNSSKYIGELIGGLKIGFSRSFENVIYDYYTFYNPKNVSKTKLFIKIKTFSISEKALQNRMVEGQIKYEIEAFTVQKTDTNRICTSRNSASYTRTQSGNYLQNIEKQVATVIDGGYKYILGYIHNSKSNLEAFATDSKVIIRPFFVKNTIDTVYYQQRKVVWSDFKGPIRSNESFGAAIFTSFGFESKIYVEKNTVTVEITPKVFTDKNMSWAKPEIKNTYALGHEQLHFDICYLQTLRFLEKIKTFKEETQDDLISRIKYEYLEYYRETHKIQVQYDEESNHSINRPKQIEWQERIAGELKKMDLSKIITP